MWWFFLVDTIKVVILVVAELLQLFATKSLKRRKSQTDRWQDRKKCVKLVLNLLNVEL